MRITDSISQQGGLFFGLRDATKDKIKVTAVAMAVFGFIAMGSQTEREFYARAFSFGLQSLAICGGLSSGHYFSMASVGMFLNAVVTPREAALTASMMGVVFGATGYAMQGYIYGFSAGLGLGLGWIPGECFSENLCFELRPTVNGLIELGFVILAAGTTFSSMSAGCTFCADCSATALNWLASKVTSSH